MFADFDWVRAVWTSPITVCLLACSVFALGMALERAIYYRKRRGNSDATFAAALQKLRDGDLRQAAWLCSSAPHPMGAVASQVLAVAGQGPAVMEERMLIAITEQRLLLERNLGVLGTLAAAAPLIGLLGTVWGIMRSFHDMAASGSTAPTVVSAGVAEALLTTAVGLIIAVPSLFAYNYFARSMQVMLTTAENQTRALRLGVEEMTGPARPRGTGTEDPSSDASAEVEGLRRAFESIPTGVQAAGGRR